MPLHQLWGRELGAKYSIPAHKITAQLANLGPWQDFLFGFCILANHGLSFSPKNNRELALVLSAHGSPQTESTIRKEDVASSFTEISKGPFTLDTQLICGQLTEGKLTQLFFLLGSIEELGVSWKDHMHKRYSRRTLGLDVQIRAPLSLSGPQWRV